MIDRALPSLNVLQNEIAAFRETGEVLHLTHALRALDEARGELEEMISDVLVHQLVHPGNVAA